MQAADPGLKAPPGFQTLILKRYNGTFNLNLVSELAPPYTEERIHWDPRPSQTKEEEGRESDRSSGGAKRQVVCCEEPTKASGGEESERDVATGGDAAGCGTGAIGDNDDAEASAGQGRRAARWTGGAERVYRRRRRDRDRDVACAARPSSALLEGDENATADSLNVGVDGAAAPCSSSGRASSARCPPAAMKQMYLDLGQRSFGLAKCQECGLLYSRGEVEDEKVHDAFHAAQRTARRGGAGIACRGWEGERVVWTDAASGDRILLLTPDDPPRQWAKAKGVAASVEETLSMPPAWLLEPKGVRVALYLSGGRIVGALFGEPIKRAYRTVPPAAATAAAANAGSGGDATSGSGAEAGWAAKATVEVAAVAGGMGVLMRGDDVQPAVCGVRGVWVHASHRRRGVARPCCIPCAHILYRATSRPRFNAPSHSPQRRAAPWQPTSAVETRFSSTRLLALWKRPGIWGCCAHELFGESLHSMANN